MIQIISKNVCRYEKILKNLPVELSEFSDYKSFDLYDVNIINLSTEELWCNIKGTNEGINEEPNLIHIKKAIQTSNSKIIIVMPKNYNFKYCYHSYNGKYDKKIQLKNMTTTVKNMLTSYIYDCMPNLSYEKGVSYINNEKYSSDFYFEKSSSCKIVLECDKSKKINTVEYDNRVIFTTLNILEIENEDNIENKLMNFLRKINPLDIEEKPDWIKDIMFYSDKKFIEEIQKSKEKMNELNMKITDNEENLRINESYKSIMYSTGEKLSKQVNLMLKEIFLISEKFEDTCEEDNNFKYNNVTFIVESKGLNNEVAGKNVSDAYDHLVIYEDKLEQKGITETTKCLFFVANERLKKPEDRAPIKDRQITIAKRNKTLIVDTVTFYKIFEDFCIGKITAEDIFKIFYEQTGLIDYKSDV